MKPGPGAATAAICLVCLVLTAAAARAELPPEIQYIIKAHRIPEETVSIVVKAVDEDAPRLVLNADTPRNPASAVKLVTTWTALDMLGPNHTWRTRVYALGPIEDGVLKGDLLIKGYGDPHLVIEEFWKLVGDIRRQGIRDIEGDLLIDDSRFEIDGDDPGAFDGEAYRLYNVLPSALLVNFKSFDFVFRPDAATNKLAIEAIPDLPNLKITNHVKLVSGPCRGNAIHLLMDVADPTAADHVIFSGRLPFACRNYKLSRSVMTPERYAYGTFLMLWQQWGGTHQGGFGKGVAPAGARPLFTWRSRPLGEIIRPLNKWSNNVMTRLLLYTIGETGSNPPIKRSDGVTALTAHLAKRGLDTTDLVIDNGSGLSRDTRVSAGFMVRLLDLAWHSPTMPEYIASLSIPGKDGTMRRRFRGRAESGRMHLKTGRLDDVVAIAGYVHAKSGKTFIVCMLANHRNVHRGPGGELQEAVLSWAFRQ
jgi:serine-type D-Ala-D-Ala carboxypeptidase/endopeptidase (penicillin-binding protein 4)